MDTTLDSSKMARNLFTVTLCACLALTLASLDIDSRIAGGYVAQPNQFPYQVAIYLGIPEIPEPSTENFCSGSLISQNYVLTAAHCLIGAENATIIIGGQEIDDLEQGQIVTVSSDFIIPEDYDSSIYSPFQWDIALIKLSQPVEFSDAIQPIKLAEGDDEYAGNLGTVAGWGATNGAQQTIEPALRWIKSVIITYGQCIKDNSFYEQVVEEGSNICQLADTKSACRGDSGAPLTLDGVQIGVVAYTPGNCLKGYPVVYARVAKYVYWIKENSDII